jgi:hypothetical protein
MLNLPPDIYEIYVQHQKSSWTVRRDNKYQATALTVGQRWLHVEGAPELGRKQRYCAWVCVCVCVCACDRGSLFRAVKHNESRLHMTR